MRPRRQELAGPRNSAKRDAIARVLAQQAPKSATADALAQLTSTNPRLVRQLLATRGVAELIRRSQQPVRGNTGPVTQDNNHEANSRYAATYLASALERLRKGGQDAMRREKTYLAAHVAAQKKRDIARVQSQRQARKSGRLIGWYTSEDDKTTPDCRAADGCNFYANQGTVIGFPGAAHPNCRCRPGPPHEGGRMVNEAVRAAVAQGLIVL